MHLEDRTLDGARDRQDVVGDARRGRHVVVEHHDEVEPHERLEDAMGVGVGDERIRRVDDERAHRIRLARLHRMQHEIGRRGGEIALRQAAAQLLGELSRLAVPLVALQRRALRVEAPGAVFRGERVGHLHVDLGDEVARLRQNTGALLVDVARDGAQAADRTVRGRDVYAHLVDAASRHERRRLRGAEQARRAHDIVLGNAALLGRTRRRVGPHMRGELLESVAPLIDERPVDEPLLDDHMHERQRERAVGAGADRQPDIGQGGDLRASRIDDDERRLGLGELDDGAPERRVVRLRGVGAPDEQALGQSRRDVGLDRPSERERVHPDARVPADLPDPHVVGAAEQVGELVVKPGPRASGALGEGKGLRAVLLAQIDEPLCDLVECLIPGDLLPLSAASLAGALQRPLKTVGIVHEAVKVALLVKTLAHIALVVRAVRIALDVDNPAILLGH